MSNNRYLSGQLCKVIDPYGLMVINDSSNFMLKTNSMFVIITRKHFGFYYDDEELLLIFANDKIGYIHLNNFETYRICQIIQ